MAYIKSATKLLFGSLDTRIRIYLRLINYCKAHRLNNLSILIANRLQRSHGIFISPKAKFDRSLTLKHPVGIVIGDGVMIERDVTIYQNVTLGGARVGDSAKNNYPIIGQGSVIFAGSVIVGKVKIGKNCIVGANSVVVRDVPDFATVVGAPAKVVNISNE
ncbi:serine O-acetyltransferase [Pseudoalteromonas sp. P1-25]|uniref:serine O-acetyltransferase n=1 Tax=Pseudoalteromonas sp. P1-25 TaxID=1723758 RepID=UPI0006D67F37|nr:serine acetyltransferase [Pseudoalteromonas sp. P1-25]KPZ51753.1 Serine acetyltransferase [Pseudoalteromonas sp. P1-25]